MGYDSEASIVAVFLLSGIPWWYFIGRIGWQIRGRSMSRWTLGVGAIVALFAFLVCTSMTVRVLQADLGEGSLTSMALLQYTLTASLCLGALVSGVCAVIATSRQ